MGQRDESEWGAGVVSFAQVHHAYLLLHVSMMEMVRELNLDMDEMMPDERLLEAFTPRCSRE
ncbi:hypothetical protein [Paenibacillus sp. GCM10027626]|uniref:hypothetical protein n=1 Tax=Paenibacillus sp. GCM10027626 TaxID=3273411 RepID=UPI00363D4CBC